MNIILISSLSPSYFMAGATASFISAKENSTVSLPCFVPDPATSTHWYKWSSDSVNTHNPLLSDYQLVNVTQNSTSSYKLNNKNNSSSLVINNYSSGNDSGYYYCKKEISDTRVLLSCPALLTNPPGTYVHVCIICIIHTCTIYNVLW